jgi:hypothetical protein
MGYAFTWDNKREGAANVQVRLDRGTATASFLSMFPMTQVEHIPTEESDHMALLVKIAAESHRRVPRGARGFKFEEMWVKHENYEAMVKEAWEQGGVSALGINGLWRRLHDMSGHIERWSFETFGSVRAEIKALRSKLEEAKMAALVSDSSLEVRGIEKQLHEIYEREDIMYRQR